MNYRTLSPNIIDQINKTNHIFRGFDDKNALRRNPGRDQASVIRPAFVRDCEKILHHPYYSRYSDKTQVFSFYSNDDISRRALHVQLVSRIARNIGRVLGLNLDLIEAIALGHDLGHTPFGHAGEKFLNDIYHQRTGRYFAHNLQSARILDTVFGRNLTLQTLDGILCHNGEFELGEYFPGDSYDFAEFDRRMQDCEENGEEAIKALIPCTLEGCVVRVCDMIAYLGRDRQDAQTAHILSDTSIFTGTSLGTINSEIINNITVDLIENSFGKDYICLSKDTFDALRTVKQENYRYIYGNNTIVQRYDSEIKPMFADMYEALLDQTKTMDRDSVLYKHVSMVNTNRRYYSINPNYQKEDPDRIVVDFIASMTDDYFIELYKFLFPNKPCNIRFISYFE